MSSSSLQLPATCFQPLLFDSLGSRQVVTDFSAGHLSSDGGMLLLRQLDEGLGISRSLAGCFRDFRNPLLIEHSIRELVAQRLLGLAAGYEDLNDHNLLRLDPLFAVAVGKEDPLGTGRALQDQGKALASASTLNRLELGNNKNTRCHKISANHEAIEDTLLLMGVRCLPKHSQEVVIDLDASDNPLHGQQEGRFFHGFYGCYCYLPLFAFVGSVPLWAELRTSDGDAARGAVDALKKIVSAVRKRCPKAQIIVRADSGFCREEIRPGAKLNNQSSIIVWGWLATAGYGNCWRINLPRVRELAILCGGVARGFTELDRPQILLAVATDTQGVPIHLEVLRGNRADTTTLQGLLASLQRRFGIEQAIFVFDNGMSSALNLEAMRKEALHFVTRLSSATLRELIAQLPQDAQPQLWDRTKLLELSVEGKRYVIAGGEYRQKHDFARRTARLEKAERELQRLAAVRRKKPNPQKLASQVGRKLQQLKTHKYFQYQVDEQGQLQYQKNDELIRSEQNLDGLYLLHTDLEVAQCAKEQVLGNYKNLLAVEDAFCQLKSYMEVRPVFHWRPDRVRNHVRLCFIAYWLCAKLANEWRVKGEKGEVQRLLRRLQAIRVGTLKIADQDSKRLLTQIPPELNTPLGQLGLLPLFSQPPAWAEV